MKSNNTICTKCVMDTTAEEIEFDDNGVCSFCYHYSNSIVKDLHVSNEDEIRFKNLIEKIKVKCRNKKYDCIIGVSGGVDSSYVAYILKKKYNLRIFAVHLDNGWNSELAVSNLENVLNKLDIDLYTYVLDWNEFRDIQLSFLKSGISNIEIPTDHAIWALLIKTAAKMNIPYIIAGNNVVTESIMPESWLYGSKDSKLIKSIHKRFGSMKLKTYPRLTTFDYIRYLLIVGIRWIPLLNYIPYSKSEAKKTLINELGWRDYGGKHYESIFTRFFHSFYLPQKFGYDLRKSYLSAMICSGQISRDEALLELDTPPASNELIHNDKDYVKKKFNLSDTEFNYIISSANKNYNDYPNNNFIWRKFEGFIRIARKYITRIN